MKECYIKVRLKEEEKERMTIYALQCGMTLSEYIKHCCLENIPAKNYTQPTHSSDFFTNNDMQNIITNLINKLPIGRKFTIKDLLLDYWPKLNYGQRRQLGKIFYHQVIETNLFPQVKFLQKRSDNHAEYQKEK